MENTIEPGKIMQLHGLSAAQYNGCIVDVGEFDENTTRYSCEAVLGELKGKKLAVKMSNLIEVPRPSPYAISSAASKYSILSEELSKLKGNKGESKSMRSYIIDKLIHETEELISILPNCATLWSLLYKFSKNYLYMCVYMHHLLYFYVYH